MAGGHHGQGGIIVEWALWLEGNYGQRSIMFE